MANKAIVRLLPNGAPGRGMEPMTYVDPTTVTEGSASESGYIFFTNEDGNVNAGIWECTPCTEQMRNYPFDQCCFVLEGTVTITDESGHVEMFGPGEAFMIPRGFNGSWRMTERYRNFFVTVEPKQ